MLAQNGARIEHVAKEGWGVETPCGGRFFGSREFRPAITETGFGAPDIDQPNGINSPMVSPDD